MTLDIATPILVPLVRSNIAAIKAEIWKRVEAGGTVVLDLEAVTAVDSAGAALLALASRQLQKQGGKLELCNIHPSVAETLDLFPFYNPPRAELPEPLPFLEYVGAQAEHWLEIIIAYLSIVADSVIFLFQALFRPKLARPSVVLYEMSSLGSQATGVVATIAFLVGGTMALQSAAQLRQFGANVFVVDLIGVAMTRELGPLMAAIMVAGRSGSAVAAEIGTMVINEEVDALNTMGINPIRFLVVPKLLAISLTQPLLTAIADVAGIFGGFLVAVLYLDVGPATFMDRLQGAVLLKDLLTGIFKSVMFAQLIVTVGAVCGFRTKGGADAVGRSTTTSVVAGIFCVITADAFASLFFYFGE